MNDVTPKVFCLTFGVHFNFGYLISIDKIHKMYVLNILFCKYSSLE